jgi:hypothetical protein
MALFIAGATSAQAQTGAPDDPYSDSTVQVPIDVSVSCDFRFEASVSSLGSPSRAHVHWPIAEKAQVTIQQLSAPTAFTIKHSGGTTNDSHFNKDSNQKKNWRQLNAALYPHDL